MRSARKVLWRVILQVCCTTNNLKSSEVTIQFNKNSQEELNVEDFRIDEIQSTTVSPWKTGIIVNGIPLTFKLYCGSDATIITNKQFKHLKEQGQISEGINKRLVGTSQLSLPVKGGCDAELLFKNEIAHEHIYVADDCVFPLLSRQALSNLEMLTWVNSIQNEELKEKFLKLW